MRHVPRQQCFRLVIGWFVLHGSRCGRGRTCARGMPRSNPPNAANECQAPKCVVPHRIPRAYPTENGGAPCQAPRGMHTEIHERGCSPARIVCIYI